MPGLQQLAALLQSQQGSSMELSGVPAIVLQCGQSGSW